MPTTRKALKRWFTEGVKKDASYMIVVCDTFDHEDYPVYVKPSEDFWETHASYHGKNMQRIMEVYDLKLSWEEQSSGRVYNTPPREMT